MELTTESAKSMKIFMELFEFSVVSVVSLCYDLLWLDLDFESHL